MISTIAVGTDGSQTAEIAVDAAFDLAERLGAARGLAITTDAGEGDPADVLVRLAEKHGADVIVIGNKGMQRRVLGSVPNSVTHKAQCSVFVVKTT